MTAPPDFAKGASGPTEAFNTSPTGLGFSPAYLASSGAGQSGNAYTTYAPTWASSGTAVALGNGTLTGRYMKIGSFVHFTVQLTAGSTTTFGTGTYTFTLPVAAAFTTGVVGTVLGYDSSALTSNTAVALMTGGVINLHYPLTWPTGTDTTYGQTTPFTWATGDFIYISGTYEAT